MPPIGPSPTNTLDVLLHQNPTIAANSCAMVATVTVPPGDPGSGPHRHSGAVFGYVLEGEILFELEGEEPYPVKAGQAFWEPGFDVVHYQAANLRSDIASQKASTRSLMPEGLETVLNPQAVADLIAFLRTSPSSKPANQ